MWAGVKRRFVAAVAALKSAFIAMWTGLRYLFSTLFPIPIWKSAESYRTAALANPRYAQLRTQLENATGPATLTVQTLFTDYASGYVEEQHARAASIIARAQTLLVSQTLVGALLALATALIGHSDIVDQRGVMPALLTFVAYTIIQILILTINALRATAGLSVAYPGVAPLIAGVPQGDLLFQRHMGLEFINTYWDLDVSNTWRANHFRLAQACLRNIIFALAFLVVILVAAVFHTGPEAPLMLNCYQAG
jgi:hypothetical protein